MIHINRLTKIYGRTAALTEVTLNVGRGESVGVVGRAGSGRSTLLRILATLVPPTSGGVVVDGLDVVADVFRVRSRIAYVGDVMFRPTDMRVSEYLRLVQTARQGRRRVGELDAAARRAGLHPSAPVDDLSAADCLRLNLAVALTMPADVLALDEPFRLLDAQARAVFVPWLIDARRNGATLLVTGEAENDVSVLCDRVVPLDAGRLGAVVSLPLSRTPAAYAAVES